MSGGSYEYFSRRSSDEQLSAIARYADSLISDMRKFVAEGIAYNESFKHDKSQPYERPVTEIERFACDAALARVVDFVSRVKALSAEVEQYAEIFHYIEWTASCDTGPSAVTEACVKFIEKKIGVKLATPPATKDEAK